MATAKVCDVFKTMAPAKTFRIRIEELDDGGVMVGDPILKRNIDLCDKGLKRLVKFTTDGLTPPGSSDAPAGKAGVGSK